MRSRLLPALTIADRNKRTTVAKRRGAQDRYARCEAFVYAQRLFDDRNSVLHQGRDDFQRTDATQHAVFRRPSCLVSRAVGQEFGRKGAAGARATDAIYKPRCCGLDRSLANPYPRTPAMAPSFSDHVWTAKKSRDWLRTQTAQGRRLGWFGVFNFDAGMGGSYDGLSQEGCMAEKLLARFGLRCLGLPFCWHLPWRVSGREQIGMFGTIAYAIGWVCLVVGLLTGIWAMWFGLRGGANPEKRLEHVRQEGERIHDELTAPNDWTAFLTVKKRRTNYQTCREVAATR